MKRTLLLSFLILASALCAAAQTQPAPARTKPALLVIDIQNAFLPLMDEKNVKESVPTINYVIRLFRDNGFPVIRVQHTTPGYGPEIGTEAFEMSKDINVRPDDPQVIKNFPNSFKKTGLNALLKEKGVNTVFLCGLSSTGCVLATFLGAEDLDYGAFMVRGALIGPAAEATGFVEKYFQTIDYWALKLLLENIRR